MINRTKKRQEMLKLKPAIPIDENTNFETSEQKNLVLNEVSEETNRISPKRSSYRTVLTEKENVGNTERTATRPSPSKSNGNRNLNTVIFLHCSNS